MFEIFTAVFYNILQISTVVGAPIALAVSYALYRTTQKRREEYEEVLEAQKTALRNVETQLEELNKLRASLELSVEGLQARSMSSEEREDLLLEYRIQEDGFKSLASSSRIEIPYTNRHYRRYLTYSYRGIFNAFIFRRLYDRSGENVRVQLREIERQQIFALRELEERIFEIGSFDPEIRSLAATVLIENDENEGDKKLEPNVLIGVLGSIASIISLMQQNKDRLDPKAILLQFRTRAQDQSTPEHKLGRIAKDADILANARTMIGLHATDSLFLDRIREKCLNPYYGAITDHELDDVDLEDIRGATANCVCTNISIARKDNGGSFPSEDFKKLWKQFGCT